MKIAILGATSQIAQDLILSFSRHKSYELLLFARNVKLLKEWVDSEGLDNKYQVKTYSYFSNNQSYDVIINFVGVGDPVKAQKIGRNILKITSQYDNVVLDYLQHHKETKYIFLSSGAVYGGNFQQPVSRDSIATINNLSTTSWYAISKLQAEIKHQALINSSIVNIRVFNYFSHTQDANAKFLITNVVRAIKNKEIFKTSVDNIVRDFVTPPDFYNLIQAIIDSKPTNTTLDCYTKSPIAKFDLLFAMKDKFNLNYEIAESLDIVNIAGHKMHYYSTSNNAKNIGYEPKNTSLEGVVKEIEKLV